MIPPAAAELLAATEQPVQRALAVGKA